MTSCSVCVCKLLTQFVNPITLAACNVDSGDEGGILKIHGDIYRYDGGI